jgi:hypothetical protein
MVLPLTAMIRTTRPTDQEVNKNQPRTENRESSAISVQSEHCRRCCLAQGPRRCLF